MKIAAAPISWGVCEVPGWGRVLEAETVLREMAELGVRATELGPPGYLPTEPAQLRALLGQHELHLVGGFLAAVLHESVSLEKARESAALLSACGAEVLVLAAATGREGYDTKPELTAAQWRQLIDNAAAIRAIAQEYGLRTVLHPHIGTQVETTEEIHRFLADSDMELCLDTGHLLIGGTDPVELARQHPDRIGHVHLKDVRAPLADAVRAGDIAYTHAVREGIFCPLGDGDVDIATMVRIVADAGYQGWYVLEQDIALGEKSDPTFPRSDTARSIGYLRQIGGQ